VQILRLGKGEQGSCSAAVKANKTTPGVITVGIRKHFAQVALLIGAQL